LGLEAPLPLPLLRLELDDLILDGSKKLLPLSQCSLDLLAPSRPLGHDLLLAASCLLKLGLALLDLVPEPSHLVQDLRVLI